MDKQEGGGEIHTFTLPETAYKRYGSLDQKASSVVKPANHRGQKDLLRSKAINLLTILEETKPTVNHHDHESFIIQAINSIKTSRIKVKNFSDLFCLTCL